MFEIVGLQFHVYGAILAIAVLVGYQTITAILKKEKIILDTEALALWIILSGIIGARFYHVITDWQLYQNDFISIFKIWQGGLGVIGAVVGGVVGLWLGLKHQQKAQYFFKIIDSAFLALPICQAIGRWGNYFNHELFGLPTQLPWGIFIDVSNRPQQYLHFSFFHPLFLYEIVLLLALLLVEWKGYKIGKWKVGQLRITSVYLMGYSLIRFGLEFLRIDSAKFAGNAGILNVAQWIMLGLFFFGLFLFFKKRESSHA